MSLNKFSTDTIEDDSKFEVAPLAVKPTRNKMKFDFGTFVSQANRFDDDFDKTTDKNKADFFSPSSQARSESLTRSAQKSPTSFAPKMNPNSVFGEPTRSTDTIRDKVDPTTANMFGGFGTNDSKFADFAADAASFGSTLPTKKKDPFAGFNLSGTTAPAKKEDPFAGFGNSDPFSKKSDFSDFDMAAMSKPARTQTFVNKDTSFPVQKSGGGEPFNPFPPNSQFAELSSSPFVGTNSFESSPGFGQDSPIPQVIAPTPSVLNPGSVQRKNKLTSGNFNLEMLTGFDSPAKTDPFRNFSENPPTFSNQPLVIHNHATIMKKGGTKKYKGVSEDPHYINSVDLSHIKAGKTVTKDRALPHDLEQNMFGVGMSCVCANIEYIFECARKGTKTPDDVYAEISQYVCLYYHMTANQTSRAGKQSTTVQEMNMGIGVMQDYLVRDTKDAFVPSDLSAFSLN